MKDIFEDLHLQDLLHKIEKKERVLNALPPLDADEEMEMRNMLARVIYELRLDYKSWMLKLYKENGYR